MVDGDDRAGCWVAFAHLKGSISKGCQLNRKGRRFEAVFERF